MREQDGFLGIMPALCPGHGLGAKLVTFFPRNTAAPTHQALIAMLDHHSRQREKRERGGEGRGERTRCGHPG